MPSLYQFLVIHDLTIQNDENMWLGSGLCLEEMLSEDLGSSSEILRARCLFFVSENHRDDLGVPSGYVKIAIENGHL